MKDPVFLERVKNGEDFRIGDVLKVTIETRQSIAAGGLRTRREVVQVIEEIKAPRQVQLLPVSPAAETPLVCLDRREPRTTAAPADIAKCLGERR
jgi:hypothetical protein